MLGDRLQSGVVGMVLLLVAHEVESQWYMDECEKKENTHKWFCLCTPCRGLTWVRAINISYSFHNASDWINMTFYGDRYSIRWMGCGVQIPNDTIGNDAFSGLSNLKTLHITGQIPTYIQPKTFSGLYKLKNLTVSGMDSSDTTPKHRPGWSFTPPTFHQHWLQPLPQLRVLDLSCNNIQSFPRETFCGLHNLTSLDLSFNHFSLTRDLGLLCRESSKPNSTCSPCMPSLSHLDLSNNNLSVLDVDLTKDMPQLSHLDLSHCFLDFVGSEFFGALIRRTQIVDFSNNNLSSLSIINPIDCDNSKIRSLVLKNNQLRHIPADVFQCAHNLKYLDLTGNLLSAKGLKAGFAHLRRIKWLKLSANSIFSLKHLLTNMDNLTSFGCSQCNITHISTEVFDKNQKLESLILSANNLAFVDNTSFTCLENVHILDLSENHLFSFDVSGLLPSLRRLNLSGNAFHNCPDFSGPWSNLTSLDLSRNNITSVSWRHMSGLTNLEILWIVNNTLTKIHRHTFSPVKKLRVLNMSRNALTDINFIGKLNKVTHLELEYNQFKAIASPDLWMPHYLKSIRHWNMRGNNVRYAAGANFPRTLEWIDLSQNHIFRVEDLVNYNDYLRFINLTYNRITYLDPDALKLNYPKDPPQVYLEGNPLDCNCNLEWLKKALVDNWGYVQIVDKNITYCKTPPDKEHVVISELEDVELLCPYDEECYDCDCCDSEDKCSCRAYCFEQCSCFHDYYNDIDRMNCTTRNITYLPPGRLSYAKDIFLDGNNLPFLRSAGLYFKYVERLFLNKSSVSLIEPRTFHFLREIKELYLQENTIEKLPNEAFDYMTTLEILYLQRNKIHLIENNSFDHLPSIVSLFLHENQLEKIDLTLFDQMRDLVEITLHGNPWSCTSCSFGPAFQGWLSANSRIIANISNIFCTARVPNDVMTERCSNINLTGVKVDNQVTIYKPVLDFDFCFCKNDRNHTIVVSGEEQLVIGLVSMAAAFLAAGTLVVVVHVNRLLILVLVYNRFGVRLCWKHKDTEEKLYDVFIAHAPADEMFVVQQLLPVLEQGERALRVCLEARDWPGGVFITDTIIASVQQSKRTILLVSENYFESQWTEYEFQVAHFQVLKDKQTRLVVVVTDPALRARMEADMRLYLRTGCCLTFTDRWFWEKLRYFMPDEPQGPAEGFIPLNVMMGQNHG